MTRWQFGPYRVEALLGRGGMSEVYRAYDASQDRVVALKLLARQFAADEQYQERFRRESQAAARLREPHVIPIHRYGELDGRLFIDMRLVEGDSLAAVLARNGSMSPLRTALIIEQVASALDAAHADGLVHRDVKPSNVLLTSASGTGGRDFVYLVDFGISRTFRRSPTTSLTETGAMIGTPEYMAPERFVDGSIDQQVDVYALACLVYECLTARPPFPKNDLPALIFAHVNTPPPRPSMMLPNLPESVDAVVAVGMAKDPTVRYSTAGELASALRTAVSPSRPATVTSVNENSLTHPRLRRRIVVLAGGVMVLLAALGTIIGTIVWGSTSSRTIDQPPTGTTPVVENTIIVGSKPESVAITPDGKNGYVTSIDSKDLSIIDTSTNTVTATVPIQAGPPQYIAIAPDGKHAYATIYDPRSEVHAVSVIDTKTKKVTATISVGLRPYGLAVTPDGSEIYVADHDSATISVISATSNKVVTTIGVAPNPHWIVFSPDGHTAYVADHESNVMSIIDTATKIVTSVVPTGKSPHSVAVSPDGRQIDVTDYDANTVTVIDAFRRVVATTVPVGVNPRWVGYSPDSRYAYIVNEESGTLSVIDALANHVTSNVSVGRTPTVGAVSPDGRHVYVVNQDSNTVSVVRVMP